MFQNLKKNQKPVLLLVPRISDKGYFTKGNLKMLVIMASS
jgi:hypothetical protein